MTDDDFRLEAQLDRARAERDALRAEVEDWREAGRAVGIEGTTAPKKSLTDVVFGLRAEVEGLKREAKVAHDAASAAIALKEAAEAELAAPKAQPQELHNVGPCVHGQCPWEPCAECGERKKPAPLALAELKAQLAAAREDALEEAAKACVKIPAVKGVVHEDYEQGYNNAVDDAVEQIRALKTTTKGGGT